MLDLPEEYELISFFECEPQLADPSTPWCYNNLHFSTFRGQDHIVCEIEPAYGELKLWWKQAGQLRAHVKLNKLESLSVHVGKEDDYMIVSGPDNSPATLFKLRLKPFVSVEIGCLHE